MMRGAVYSRYGSQSAVELRELERPGVDENQILVRVRAAAVNPLDWRRLTGTPYLLVRRHGGWFKPRHQRRLGADFAGVVETVGREVTLFRPGDEVFGSGYGSFAEYMAVREAGSVAHKPSGVSFEEAAAVPVAAGTALEGLRDHGRLRPGQRVLVNGASGGVGGYAVQLAKAFGAEVTGVCSGRNAELVRSLGADHVIDYTREDFTATGQRYDLILDNVSNRSWPEYKRILLPGAALVFAGGLVDNLWIGPTRRQNRIERQARSDGHAAIKFRGRLPRADVEELARLMEAGKLRSAVHRTYRLDGIAEALRLLGEGHVPGKLVILP